MKKYLLLCLIVVLVFSGCSSNNNIEDNSSSDIATETFESQDSTKRQSYYLLSGISSDQEANEDSEKSKYFTKEDFAIKTTKGDYTIKANSIDQYTSEGVALRYMLSYSYSNETCNSLKITGDFTDGDDYLIIKDSDGSIISELDIYGAEDIVQGETCYVSCFFDAENLNTRFFDITTNNSQKSEQPGYIRIPSSEFKVIKEKKADLLLDDSQSEENNIEEPTKNYGDSAEPEDRMGQNIKMESEEEYIKALTKRLGWEDYELSDPKVTSGKDMGMDADLKTRALAYSKGGIRQKLPIILAFQLDDSNDIVSTYLMANDTSSSSEHFNRIAEIIINTDDVTLRKSTITDSVNDAIDSDGDMIDMGNGLKFGYDSSFGDTGISMFLFTREDIS